MFFKVPTQRKLPCSNSRLCACTIMTYYGLYYERINSKFFSRALLKKKDENAKCLDFQFHNLKVNKSAYIAKSRKRYHKTLNNILLLVPNLALKDVGLLNYGIIKNTNSSHYTPFFAIKFFII